MTICNVPHKKTRHVTCDVIEQLTIRIAIGHYLRIGDPLEQSLYLQPFWRYLASKCIGVTTLTFQDHVTSSVTWPFDSHVAISYRRSIVTKSLYPAIFEIMDIKHIVSTTLTIHCHATSSITRPFDSQVVISCRFSIVVKSLSPTVSEILDLRILGARPWPWLYIRLLSCVVCMLGTCCPMTADCWPPLTYRLLTCRPTDQLTDWLLTYCTTTADCWPTTDLMTADSWHADLLSHDRRLLTCWPALLLTEYIK